MRRARAMFDDDADASVRANSPKAEGDSELAFQTAAGTALEVSEAAMRKSRSMFDDAGDDQNDASVDTPKRPYENFPQPSFKTPKSLPVARKATGKVPGFTPPMKTGAAFTPPMSKLGPKTVASAPRQPARSRRGEEASAPVHDMFAARARMGMRALGKFSGSFACGAAPHAGGYAAWRTPWPLCQANVRGTRECQAKGGRKNYRIAIYY